MFRSLNKLGLRKSQAIPVGRVDRGHFRRTRPISTLFGFDREGGPIDRYYIEGFLEQESGSIHGRVLEIENNEYTMRFGKERVSQSDILHVNDSNPRATIVGDISNAPQIPDNSFDCIVLTQTLHLIFDFQAAVDTCYRILKPGGTLLLTVPGITPIDHGEWKSIWYWSFTGASIQRVMENSFPKDKLTIQSLGNVAVATAFLYGLSLGDITMEELKDHDPHFPVVLTVKAIKPQ